MNKLTKIADRCGTDKGSITDEGHQFTEFYLNYFEEIKKRKNITILEIGVYYGNSLKMLNEYFGEDNVEIYGIDINLSINKYSAPNVHVYNVNQNSKTDIDNFLKDIGDKKFDIIIDDGSHQLQHQYHSMLYLYKHLKEDGIYILEDLHTHVWANEKSQSPLYFLNFYNDPLSYITLQESNELKEHIDTTTIFLRKNPKGLFNPYSITSIITFKQ